MTLCVLEKLIAIEKYLPCLSYRDGMGGHFLLIVLIEDQLVDPYTSQLLAFYANERILLVYAPMEGLDEVTDQGLENELDDLNRPTVDFLILADRAEVLNGKLYMMGGGWDRLNIRDFGKQQSVGIAVGLQIPWHATNQQHQLSVRIESSDNVELFTAQLGFTTGRPAVLRTAEAQRVIFAFSAALTLPGPGTFTVKAIVNDVPDRRGETFFHVALAPGSTVAQAS